MGGQPLPAPADKCCIIPVTACPRGAPAARPHGESAYAAATHRGRELQGTAIGRRRARRNDGAHRGEQRRKDDAARRGGYLLQRARRPRHARGSRLPPGRPGAAVRDARCRAHLRGDGRRVGRAGARAISPVPPPGPARAPGDQARGLRQASPGTQRGRGELDVCGGRGTVIGSTGGAARRVAAAHADAQTPRQPLRGAGPTGHSRGRGCRRRRR